jgi:hypothetical protein
MGQTPRLRYWIWVNSPMVVFKGGCEAGGMAWIWGLPLLAWMVLMSTSPGQLNGALGLNHALRERADSARFTR